MIHLPVGDVFSFKGIVNLFNQILTSAVCKRGYTLNIIMP